MVSLLGQPASSSTACPGRLWGFQGPIKQKPKQLSLISQLALLVAGGWTRGLKAPPNQITLCYNFVIQVTFVL